MQFDVAPFATNSAGEAPRPQATAATDLLRQLVEMQREQLELLKAQQANMAEVANRKRAWFDRWQDEFGDLPETSRQIMPILERAYLRLMSSLVEEIRDRDEDSFESDFSLRDFVDRYGFTITHLGGILAALAPLAELTNPAENAE